MVLFMTGYIAKLVNNELERIWWWSNVSLISVLAWREWEQLWKISVIITIVLLKFEPDTPQIQFEHYCYAITLSQKLPSYRTWCRENSVGCWKFKTIAAEHTCWIRRPCSATSSGVMLDQKSWCTLRAHNTVSRMVTIRSWTRAVRSNLRVRNPRAAAVIRVAAI